MKRLLILGAGQYGMVAKEVAEAMNTFDEIAFLDDNSEFAIGRLEDIDSIDYDAAFVAMGNPQIRQKWFAKIRTLATLIHPKACIMPSAEIGEGCIIEPGAMICSNAKIGKGTIVMSNAVVGHDAGVGDCCQLKYCSVISERCILPNETKVECGVVVK